MNYTFLLKAENIAQYYTVRRGSVDWQSSDYIKETYSGNNSENLITNSKTKFLCLASYKTGKRLSNKKNDKLTKVQIEINWVIVLLTTTLPKEREMFKSIFEHVTMISVKFYPQTQILLLVWLPRCWTVWIQFFKYGSCFHYVNILQNTVEIYMQKLVISNIMKCYSLQTLIIF